MKKRILGLDTGTNSLGWAVVDKHDDGSYSLVNKGSLIFQEGVKIEKKNESSKAAERTGYRASRRHYFRRRLRKIEVLKVLVKYELCPYLSDEALNLWHTKKIYPMNDAFMEWQRTNENSEQNPYYYRHVCLHEKLDLEDETDRFVLGRAMYHLAQRRGFLSNRLDQTEDNDETGKVKSAISDLTESMEQKGCEYLGDYFYKLYSEDGNHVRIRNRYTDREAHYQKEFNAICECQELPSEMSAELSRALYFQRPLKSQCQGVGKCTMEKGKARCADSHPEFERFRMFSVLNNIKVQGPHDDSLRPLNADERKKAEKCFYVKKDFNFESIAKAIAGKGKGKYQYIKDAGDCTYKFNYRMTQNIACCPTIKSLQMVFDSEDYRSAMAECYTLASGKSLEDIETDIWNVLYSFSSKDKLREFAVEKLQLNDEKAEQFSKIRLSRNFASLSLKAIRKINPFLEMGLIYSHATMLANIPTIIGKERWGREGNAILDRCHELIDNYNPHDVNLMGTLDVCLKSILVEEYNVEPCEAEKLYHPSMIEAYADAQRNHDGVYQLGSPRTNAVRNPMAMRSLHELRKVVNKLLKERIIDENTEVHVEYARELNDANKRKALAVWNNEQEKRRKKYADDIVKLFHDETGLTIVPTDTDILKFQLWEEQNHICLYTGKQIGIADFLGANPKFDIEHTIPRSAGGDSTMMNMTLCESRFNRDVKKAKIPTQLANHDEIMSRLAEWKQNIDKMTRTLDSISTSVPIKEVKDKKIQMRHRQRIELDYWRGKYNRFTMTEVPEGFSLRQGIGIGLVSKYAGLFLKSLFHKKDDRNRSNVRVIKGVTTAEFRKMWGIQDEYEKKSRDNHAHHCIDAITVACIGADEYNKLAAYHHAYDEYSYNHSPKPTFDKPWPTFTEDVKAIADELLVVHDTPDNMPKRARKRIKVNGEFKIAKGDTARGVLHNETFYGAIERDGEIRYVVRRQLSSFESVKDIDSIVDDAVREIVRKAVEGRNFKEAIAEPIYMNKDKGVLIKKVRCYVASSIAGKVIDVRKHRDVSAKEYKRICYAENSDNYTMGIYEGLVGKKNKREYEISNMLDSIKSVNDTCNNSLLPLRSVNGVPDLPIKYALRKGQHVILFEKTPNEIFDLSLKEISNRMYIITGLSTSSTTTGDKKYSYGMISMRHCREARPSTECPEKKGIFHSGENYRAKIVMNHNQFKALLEGEDFTIDVLGNVTLKNR